MPAPGAPCPVYQTLPPWTEAEIEAIAIGFGVTQPRAEWIRRESRVVLRGGGAQMDFYRASRSLRWKTATPTRHYAGSDPREALFSISHSAEYVLPRCPLLSTEVYPIAPPTVVQPGSAGAAVTSATGRSLGMRYLLDGARLWRQRVRFDLDEADRVASVFVMANDVVRLPMGTVTTLTPDEVATRLAPGVRVAEAAVEGPGYLIAAPDRRQPVLAPVYRVTPSPQEPARYCAGFSTRDRPADAPWFEPFGGDVLLI